MDCHSPGQGLMPASFKVRTVPLEGDETATEEVLDPDFGEAAIGRVAPVDSGNINLSQLLNNRSSVLNLSAVNRRNTNFRVMVDYFVARVWKMLRRSFSTGED